jgi:hypothetical protein
MKTRRAFSKLPMAALLLVSTAAMHADTFTYPYTGNDLGPDPPNSFAPFTSSDAITGYFTVSTALAANQAFTDITGQVTYFSFSDGPETINSSTTLTTESIEVATGPTGNVDAWEVLLSGPAGTIFSCSLDPNPPCYPGPGWGAGEGDEAFYGGGVGLRENDPGMWAATPEPSGPVLLGTVLLGVIGITLRRRRLA